MTTLEDTPKPQGGIAEDIRHYLRALENILATVRGEEKDIARLALGGLTAEVERIQGIERNFVFRMPEKRKWNEKPA